MVTAAEKLKAERAKEYKCVHDVERVHHLIAAAHLMRDFPATSALAASLVRELSGMNLKQIDLDAEERAAEEREVATSQAQSGEEKKSDPTRAPSVPRR